MVGRLFAIGGTVAGRAMRQAYRPAIVNANKTGAAQEAIGRASKAMTDQEARQILGSEQGQVKEHIENPIKSELNLNNSDWKTGDSEDALISYGGWKE